MIRKVLTSFVVACLASIATLATAATAPAEIKIGTLYAASGPFAAVSMPVFNGLKLWVSQENAKGGAMVKLYGKRIPLKLIAYDDQSNTATAGMLYNQLITQDKVDLLLSDSASVLTSIAVPIARDHKMFLFNQTGTGPFFSKDNPYIALLDAQVSSAWPQYMADFLAKEGPKLGIKRLAIVYATTDFSIPQNALVHKVLKDSKAPIEIVYDNGVPISTSNYTVVINNIVASKPDAVIEFGYPSNDIAFLRNLNDSGVRFKWLFTVFPGLELKHFEQTVGASSMNHTYTYAMASDVEYKVNFGMSLPQYHDAWDKAYPDSKVAFGFNAVAGYNTGLIIQKVLATTKSMDQLALHDAVFALSGKLKTLAGAFELNAMGEQIGEITPLAQLIPDGKDKLKFAIVYPPDLATAKPVYPAPSN